MKPVQKRVTVRAATGRLRDQHPASMSTAGAPEATCYCRPEHIAVHEGNPTRWRELAGERPAFGSPRIIVMIRKEFGRVNHPRVERLCAGEWLQPPSRINRRRQGQHRLAPADLPAGPRQRGSMDVVHNMLPDGRHFKVFVVVDDDSRECLKLEVGTFLPGLRDATRLPK